MSAPHFYGVRFENGYRCLVQLEVRCLLSCGTEVCRLLVEVFDIVIAVMPEDAVVYGFDDYIEFFVHDAFSPLRTVCGVAEKDVAVHAVEVAGIIAFKETGNALDDVLVAVDPHDLIFRYVRTAFAVDHGYVFIRIEIVDDENTYIEFFSKLGIENVKYKVCEGRMSCDVAVFENI